MGTRGAENAGWTAACARRTARRLATLIAAGALTLLVVPAAASATGSAHWELISNHAPTNVPITPSVAEELKLNIISAEEGVAPDVGRLKLTVSNPDSGEEHTTKFLKFDASAEEVEAAIEGLADVGAGNVKVAGGPTGIHPTEWSYTIMFASKKTGENFEVEAEVAEPTAKEVKEAKTHAEEHGEPFEVVEVEAEEAEILQLGLRDTVDFQLLPTNRGAAPTSGTITLSDRLPSGLVTEKTPESEGEWSCTTGSGNTTVTCTTSKVIPADTLAKYPVTVVAYADPEKLKLGTHLVNEAEVSGGGATAFVAPLDEALVSNEPAPFGVHGFKSSAYDTHGNVYTTAGGHPYAATSTFFFNTINRAEFAENGVVEPVTNGDVKDIDVEVPEGFLGNPANRPHCTQAQFAYDLKGNVGSFGKAARACPPNTQVGVATLLLNGIVGAPVKAPIYNLETPRGATGVPAEFGFNIAGVPVRLDGHVRKLGGQYQVTVLSADVNEALTVDGASITLWGTPAEASHNEERTIEKEPSKRGAESTENPVQPFLTNPTSCLAEQEQQPFTTMYVDQWKAPAAELEGEPELSSPTWQKYQVAAEQVTGCENLKFENVEGNFKPRPSAEENQGTTEVSSPSGFEYELHVPQKEAVGELVTPELKDTTVTMPAGVVLSDGAANGLEACTPQEIDLESTHPGHCPAASRMGEVTIHTALLEEALTGSVYVAEPECSPCTATDDAEGKLFKLYIEAEAPEEGVNVKLSGHAVTGTLETEKEGGLKVGQVRTTFLNNPQTPFTTLLLKLKGGPRATLATPALCGIYQTESVFTPWSIEGSILGEGVIPGDKAWTATSKFEASGNGEGGPCPATFPFEPVVESGTQSSKANEYSPLITLFKRESDKEQYLRGVTVTTPPGLLGKVAGVEKCEFSAAELEAETKACPAGSQIGEATTEAGSGSQPYTVTGKVFLAGPTKSSETKTEGPFGLDVVVPAKAGPFNLGLVVVQAVIEVNEETGALTVTSNPLPQSVDGVPFRIKQAEVKINRPEFTFNATHCSSGAITGTLTGQPLGAEGEEPVVAKREVPYAATDCEALPFNPGFKASVNAHANNIDGTSFSVRVEQHHGEAAIHKVEVQLPEALPSRLETLQKACTVEQFKSKPEAAGCPAHSFVGTAEARTPLLNVPLKGVAVLESRGAKFPDLVFLLHGEGVHILLRGKTDIINGVTFSKFETVPDAPITSFVTTFPAGPYSLIGGLGNLCAEPLDAVVTITGQNNDQTKQYAHIGVEECAPVVKGVIAGERSGKLHLLVTSDQPGTLRVSGRSVRTMTRRRFATGPREVVVRLSTAGRLAAARGKKLELKVAVTAAGRTGSETIRAAA